MAIKARTNIFGDRVIVGRTMRFFLDDKPLTITKIKRKFELGTVSFYYEATAVGEDGFRIVDYIDMFRPFDNNPCAMVD
jgi:hypothetical protein